MPRYKRRRQWQSVNAMVQVDRGYSTGGTARTAYQNARQEYCALRNSALLAQMLLPPEPNSQGQHEAAHEAQAAPEGGQDGFGRPGVGAHGEGAVANCAQPAVGWDGGAGRTVLRPHVHMAGVAAAQFRRPGNRIAEQWQQQLPATSAVCKPIPSF